MTLSIWRFTHLVLAIITSLFLTVASVTGIILAYDAMHEDLQPYRAKTFEQLSLAQSLPQLKKKFPEITEITIDDNRFVRIEGTDLEGNTVKAYVDPQTGKTLGKPIIKSDFINWTTSLHRSLFLKETGRFLIGIVSILLLFIAFTGLLLFIKRQQGFKNFFHKIRNTSWAQKVHVVSGRILLLPLIFITLTGTALFLIRFNIIPKSQALKIQNKSISESPLPLAAFPIFKNTPLHEVQKIEFPFIEDDPEEFFVVKLKDRTLKINQITGIVVEEKYLPKTEVLEATMLTWHTGRGNSLLALILGISALGILLFLVSGFTITAKRTRNKIKNKYSTEEAEIIILVGSENGATLGFANQIHNQLISTGKKSFLTEMNHYQEFPSAREMIIMTSTYGLGDPPTNGEKFLDLVEKIPQKQKVEVSIVGFGSRAYDDFCAYAEKLQNCIGEKSWAFLKLPLFTVNDKSTSDFVEWAKEWSYATMIPLATAPTLYKSKPIELKSFVVEEKSQIYPEASTFKVLLKPKSKCKFQSGDLLAIYPDDGEKERFYSIGKVDGNIQFVVKYYEGGVGSDFLFNLEEEQELKGRIIENSEFHFPAKASKVAMICNGTGIAPFLGMIEENTTKTEIYLYTGFRKNTALTEDYKKFGTQQKALGKLKNLHFAFSREENSQYVMDLVKRDHTFFLDLIKNNGVIMICGALKMQHDVEAILEALCKEENIDFESFKESGRHLTDCY